MAAEACLKRPAWVALLALAGLSAPVFCADAPPAGRLLQPLVAEGDAPPAPWHVAGLPGQHKPYTRFSAVELEGRRVLRVEAEASYGLLVHPLQAGVHAHRLAWQWRVDEPNDAADLSRRGGDDSPAKVCVMFDLPIQAVPFVERQMLRLTRLHSTEPLPAATLCYVWDAHLAAGTVIDNAFTRRLRFIVLEGQGAPLHHWVAEQRDVAADFLRLFGDESTEVPPLLGVAVGADADNTQAHTVAHVDAMVLDNPAVPARPGH